MIECGWYQRALVPTLVSASSGRCAGRVDYFAAVADSRVRTACTRQRG